MTMDTVGIILVLAFGIGYLYIRKNPKYVGEAKFCLFAAGIGAGMIISAVWTLSIIDRMF